MQYGWKVEETDQTNDETTTAVTETTFVEEPTLSIDSNNITDTYITQDIYGSFYCSLCNCSKIQCPTQHCKYHQPRKQLIESMVITAPVNMLPNTSDCSGSSSSCCPTTQATNETGDPLFGGGLITAPNLLFLTAQFTKKTAIFPGGSSEACSLVPYLWTCRIIPLFMIRASTTATSSSVTNKQFVKNRSRIGPLKERSVKFDSSSDRVATSTKYIINDDYDNRSIITSNIGSDENSCIKDQMTTATTTTTEACISSSSSSSRNNNNSKWAFGGTRGLIQKNITASQHTFVPPPPVRRRRVLRGSSFRISVTAVTPATNDCKKENQKQNKPYVASKQINLVDCFNDAAAVDTGDDYKATKLAPVSDATSSSDTSVDKNTSPTIAHSPPLSLEVSIAEKELHVVDNCRPPVDDNDTNEEKFNLTSSNPASPCVTSDCTTNDALVLEEINEPTQKDNEIWSGSISNMVTSGNLLQQENMTSADDKGSENVAPSNLMEDNSTISTDEPLKIVSSGQELTASKYILLSPSIETDAQLCRDEKMTPGKEFAAAIEAACSTAMSTVDEMFDVAEREQEELIMNLSSNGIV